MLGEEPLKLYLNANNLLGESNRCRLHTAYDTSSVKVRERKLFEAQDN